MATKQKLQNKNNLVAKELGPDVMALLEDVEASIQQIKAIDGGGVPGEEPAPEMEEENQEVEMAEDVITDEDNVTEEPGDEDEDNPIMKELKAIKGMLEKNSCTKSEDDDADDQEEVEKSSTARDSADDRLLEDTMINDENLPVKKALNSLLSITKSLQPKKVVKKVPDVQTQVAKALAPFVQALTPLVNSVSTQGKALENLMKELGYAQAVEETIKVEKSKDTAKPVQKTDTGVIADVFAQLLQAVQKNNSNSGNQVNKALDDERTATETRRQNLYEAMSLVIPGLGKK